MSSLFLPPNSLQEDFLNHEPSVMFPHSGTTLVDDSSAQRHMLQALNDNNQPLLTTSVLNGLNPNGIHSSSLPWSAFESNGRPGSSGGQQERQLDGTTQPAGSAGHGSGESTSEIPRTGSEKAIGDVIQVSTHVEHLSKPAPSPVVEIRTERRTSVSSRASRAGSPTTSKRRKRRAEEEKFSSDQLNSDDKAIGLPKERYQPRPSKRRATHVPEEPVDLSVRPEKAAKVKRTKTTGDAPVESRKDVAEITKKASAPAEEVNKRLDDDAAVVSDEIAVAKESESNKVSQSHSQAVEKTAPAADVSSETEKANGEIAVTEPKEIEIFSTPTLPPAKKKLSAKAKRAQTTIFEDHVEFIGSQRSLNLSQQQAQRKALRITDNGSNRKKRKTVVSDDENEDESIVDIAEKEEERVPPKKRGRGRPPKATTKPTQKSAEKVLEDSEPENEIEAEIQPEPSKQASMEKTLIVTAAPPEAIKKAENNDARNVSLDTTSKTLTQHETEEDTENSNQIEPSSTPEKTPTAREIPTPSPEKENPAPQKDTSKGTPTSHSPIKGSSKVPLRVGLSKRQRIPSLLRVMRPPKH